MGGSSEISAYSNNLTTNHTVSVTNFSYHGVLANIELFIFGVLSVITIFANLRVLCIVATMKQRQRKNNIPIAHLSFVGISIQLFGVMYMLRKHFDLVFPLCATELIVRNVLFSLEPLNMVLIYYQRCYLLQPVYDGGKLLLTRSILLMWTVAVVGNLPVLFMSKTLGHSCYRVPLFGSVPVTGLYETIKLLVYNLAPLAYMFYSLYLIRSKVKKYLFPSVREQGTTNTNNSKVTKLQFLFLYSTVFLVMWFPWTIFLIVHKVYRMYLVKVNSEECKFNCDKTSFAGPASIPNYFGVVAIAGTLIIMFHPLVNLHLNEDLKSVRWWQFKYTRQRRNYSRNKNEARLRTISKLAGSDIERGGNEGLGDFAQSTFEMRSTVAATSVAENPEGGLGTEEIPPAPHQQKPVSTSSSSEEHHDCETFV